MIEILERFSVKELQSEEANNYIIELLEAVQSGEYGAFDLIVRCKDVCDFIDFHAKRFAYKHKNKVSIEDIENEFRLQIFFYLKKRYRIQYKQNELTIFLATMHNWLPNKVLRTISTDAKVKRDREFYDVHSNESYFDDSLFMDDVKSILDDDEINFFELYFQEGMTVRQVSKVLGKPKSTVGLRLQGIKSKLTNYFKEEYL